VGAGICEGDYQESAQRSSYAVLTGEKGRPSEVLDFDVCVIIPLFTTVLFTAAAAGEAGAGPDASGTGRASRDYAARVLPSLRDLVLVRPFR